MKHGPRIFLAHSCMSLATQVHLEDSLLMQQTLEVCY